MCVVASCVSLYNIVHLQSLFNNMHIYSMSDSSSVVLSASDSLDLITRRRLAGAFFADVLFVTVLGLSTVTAFRG